MVGGGGDESMCHMMLTGFFVSWFLLSLSQMNRPIQVKPADSESRGGTVCPSLLLFLPLFPPLPFFVLALEACCLCVSASPLSVLLHDALYLDAGWQRGLARPSSFQNTLCKQRSSWPVQPLAPFLESHHMHWWIYTHTHTYTYTDMCVTCHFWGGKRVTSFVKHQSKQSKAYVSQMNSTFKWQVCANESKFQSSFFFFVCSIDS